MSTQQQAELRTELDEAAVAEFLAQHPDFFQRHPELLGELEVPHECGGAVSLLEYQARVMRETNRTLRERLEELLAVARDNDRVSERLHRLTLELMRAEGLEGILFCLKDSLRSDFQAEVVAVKLLVDGERAQEPELVDREAAELDMFAPCLQGQRPVCGQLTSSQLKYLFGDGARSIGSTALIPIIDDGAVGLLAIGSREAERFHAGMGTIFLRQLGALLGRAIKPHLP